VEALDLLVAEEVVERLVHAFYLIDEKGDIEEFLIDGDDVCARLARDVRVVGAEEHLVEKGLIEGALESLLDGIEEDAVELGDVLLLLALVVLPAEGAGESFGGASLAFGGLQHDKEALDLQQHLALASLHEVCGLIERAFAQRQGVDSCTEGWVHKQGLDEGVKIARGALVVNASYVAWLAWIGGWVQVRGAVRWFTLH